MSNINISGITPELKQLIKDASQARYGALLGDRAMSPWLREIIEQAARDELKRASK